MDCDETIIWNCPKCGKEKELHIHWKNGEYWLMCFKCKKTHWVKCKDLLTSNKIENEN
jgi:transcription elongation factor Elf1